MNLKFKTNILKNYENSPLEFIFKRYKSNLVWLKIYSNLTIKMLNSYPLEYFCPLFLIKNRDGLWATIFFEEGKFNKNRLFFFTHKFCCRRGRILWMNINLDEKIPFIDPLSLKDILLNYFSNTSFLYKNLTKDMKYEIREVKKRKENLILNNICICESMELYDKILNHYLKIKCKKCSKFIFTLNHVYISFKNNPFVDNVVNFNKNKYCECQKLII